MLNRWFAMRCERPDRLRFWKAYCRHRAANGIVRSFHDGDASAWARELESCTRASNLDFWKSRDARCLRSNRYYRRIRTASVSGFAATDLDRGALQTLISEPDEAFERASSTLLKNGRSATVAAIELVGGIETWRVVYKRFRIASRTDPWKALMRRSPVLRSWVNGQGLRERCLPTPRPLAVFHRRSGGLAQEGYLLTVRLADAVGLAEYLANLSSLSCAERLVLLRRHIEQLARLAAAMHERGVCHRDLKAANVLVSSSPGQSPSLKEDFGPFWLIDLAGAMLGHAVNESGRMRDLTRLHASFHAHSVLTRTDKLRFLRNYLRRGCFAVQRKEWKQTLKHWWRAIESGTQAKIARNHRNGRPLA
jgi:hypothetical protein